VSTAENVDNTSDTVQTPQSKTPLMDACKAKKAAGEYVSGSEYRAAYEEEREANQAEYKARQAAQKPKKNTKATKPEVSDEEKAQLDALLSKIKTTGDMKWDDELHYGWSDDATAKRLAEVQAHNQGGNTLAWDPTAPSSTRGGDNGAWRTWDGNRWKLDTNNKEGRKHGKTVAHACRQRYAEWVACLTDKSFAKLEKSAQEYVKNKVSAWGGYSMKVGNTGGIAGGLTLLQSEPGMTPDVEWDNDPTLLATPNGTIELNDGYGVQFHQARREDWLTRSTSVGITQDDYLNGYVPTRFEKLLEETLPSEDVRRYFQKVMGYILMGENPKRKFIVLHGPTSSGKTTIMRIIADVLGEYASDFSLSLFRANKDEKARPDIIRAMNARMIYASETSQQWELDADQIKRMTGGDKVSARLNYGNDFTSRQPAFTPVLATNQAPRITGSDEAIWRRLIVFGFDNTIEAHREDPGLVTRVVREEGPAILAWLLDGWDMYNNGALIEDGWDNNRADTYVEPGLDDMPADVVTATMKFRSNLTLEDQWVSEHTIRNEGTPPVTSAAVYGAYTAWCEANGFNPNNSKVLSPALNRAGYSLKKHGGVWCRFNLELSKEAIDAAHRPRGGVSLDDTDE